MTLDQLTEAVWQRLQTRQLAEETGERRLRALLIGEPPWNYHKYDYVNDKPYDAIVLGLLLPGVLLHMPDDTVCRALLEGMPVLLWPDQNRYSATAAPALQRALLAARRRLVEYGVQLIGREERLITAERAQLLRRLGRLPPAGSRLTPLAKDILQGEST